MTDPLMTETTEVRNNPRISALFRPEAFTRLLRLLGSLTLLAAISIFLFQGWENGNDLHRFGVLFFHTALLAAIGVLSARLLQEARGARILLTIAMVSVCANFTILGAFLYSQFPLGDAAASYPLYALWQVDSAQAALFVLALALPVMLLINRFGYMVLARRSAGRLWWLALLGNAMVLVPVRDSFWIAAMVIPVTIFLLQQLHRVMRQDMALRTLEGIFVRLLLMLPVLIVLGRSMMLYAADIFTFSIIMLIAYIFARQTARQLDASSMLRTLLERTAMLISICIAVGITGSLSTAWGFPGDLVLIIFAVIFGLLMFDLSLWAADDRAFYRRAGSIVAGGGFLLNLLLIPDFLTAALCLGAGLVMLIVGYLAENRSTFVGGAVVLGAGLVYQLGQVLMLFHMGGWTSLAALGIAAILLGSIIDRHGSAIRSQMTNLGRRIRAWEG